MAKGKKTPDKRDKEALAKAIKALNASQHNPINWVAIIQFVAPILARITARWVIGRVTKRTGKRLSPKTRTELADLAADHLADSVTTALGKSVAKGK